MPCGSADVILADVATHCLTKIKTCRDWHSILDQCDIELQTHAPIAGGIGLFQFLLCPIVFFMLPRITAPNGVWFKWVNSPNDLAEIIHWTGWAILT